MLLKNFIALLFISLIKYKMSYYNNNLYNKNLFISNDTSLDSSLFDYSYQPFELNDQNHKPLNSNYEDITYQNSIYSISSVPIVNSPTIFSNDLNYFSKSPDIIFSESFEISPDIFEDEDIFDNEESYNYNSNQNTESLAYYPLSKNKNRFLSHKSNNKNVYSSSKLTSNLIRRNYKTSYVPVSPFPKIIKRDFRRFFPQMFANVFNSLDIDLFDSFIKEFVTSNFKMHKLSKYPSEYSPEIESANFSSPKFSSNRPDKLFLNRNQYLILFFYHILSFPDSVMKVSDIVLKQKINDPNTYLYFNYEINMCILNDVKHIELPDDFFLHLLRDRGSFEQIINELKMRKLSSYNSNFNYNLGKCKREEEQNLLQNHYIKVLNNYKKDIFGDYFYIKQMKLNSSIVRKGSSYIVFNEHNRINYFHSKPA